MRPVSVVGTRCHHPLAPLMPDEAVRACQAGGSSSLAHAAVGVLRGMRGNIGATAARYMPVFWDGRSLAHGPGLPSAETPCRTLSCAVPQADALSPPTAPAVTVFAAFRLLQIALHTGLLAPSNSTIWPCASDSLFVVGQDSRLVAARMQRKRATLPVRSSCARRLAPAHRIPHGAGHCQISALVGCRGRTRLVGL